MARKQKAQFSATLALVMAYSLWGINTPLIKLGVQTIPVTIFMTIKILGAALIILPFALRTWKPMKPRDFAQLAASSLLWITFGNLAFYTGLKTAPSINAAILELLGPLLLFVLSVQFLREKLSLRTFLGIVVALTGSAVIIGHPWLDAGAVGGNVLFMFAVLCHVIGTIMAKPAISKIGAYQATFIHLFFGVLPIVFLAIPEFMSFDFAQINTSGWVALLYGTFAVLLANFLLLYGLKRRQAQEIGIFFYIQPVVTFGTAAILLQEYPDARFLAGATLVFLGIYLAEAKLPDRIRLHYHHHHN